VIETASAETGEIAEEPVPDNTEVEAEVIVEPVAEEVVEPVAVEGEEVTPVEGEEGATEGEAEQ